MRRRNTAKNLLIAAQCYSVVLLVLDRIGFYDSSAVGHRYAKVKTPMTESDTIIPAIITPARIVGKA